MRACPRQPIVGVRSLVKLNQLWHQRNVAEHLESTALLIKSLSATDSTMCRVLLLASVQLAVVGASVVRDWKNNKRNRALGAQLRKGCVAPTSVAFLQTSRFAVLNEGTLFLEGKSARNSKNSSVMPASDTLKRTCRQQVSMRPNDASRHLPVQQDEGEKQHTQRASGEQQGLGRLFCRSGLMPVVVRAIVPMVVAAMATVCRFRSDWWRCVIVWLRHVRFRFVLQLQNAADWHTAKRPTDTYAKLRAVALRSADRLIG